MPKITSCISHVPVFRLLPAAGLQRLQRAMHHLHLHPGAYVVRMGDPVRSLIVVSGGLLKLCRTSKSGREQVVRELGPGQFFGEMALFTEVESEGDLVAVKETDACVLDRSAIEAELQQAPDLAWPLVEALAHQLAEAERTIGDLALLDVTQRLAAELIRLAEVHEGSSLEISLELPVSWAQLATKIGTTPESLSRRLKLLSQRDLVRVDGRLVTIVNLAGLRDVME